MSDTPIAHVPDNRTKPLPREHADVCGNRPPAQLVLDEIRSTRDSWILSEAVKVPIDHAADAKHLWILFDKRIGAPPDIGEVKDEQQARRAMRLMEDALTALLTGDDPTPGEPPSDAPVEPQPALNEPATTPPPPAAPDRPEWDRATRVLRVGEAVVTYEREAPEQFTLLDALQGARWPADGIPCPSSLRSKLKNTVDSLSKKLTATRLRVGRTENDTRVNWWLTPV